MHYKIEKEAAKSWIIHLDIKIMIIQLKATTASNCSSNPRREQVTAMGKTMRPPFPGCAPSIQKSHQSSNRATHNLTANLWRCCLIAQCLVPILLLSIVLPCCTAQSAGLAGLEIEEPENEADWPKTEDWVLAIDSASQIQCNTMKAYLQCDALGTDTITTLSSQKACIDWCPTKTTNSFQESDGIACMWTDDGFSTSCSLCATHKLVAATNANDTAGVCLPNTDFIYSSPLWHAVPSDFNDDDLHSNTNGGNKLYRNYISGGVTHVRIVMNRKTIDVAVAVSLSGRYTLQELVTNPGGSEISPRGDGNDLAPQRGNVGSLFNFVETGSFVCTNVGFNLLQSGGGDQSGSTGWHSMSQNGARVRIGVYKSTSFPCASMTSAEGVGLEVEHNRPMSQSGEGGRLNSGSIHGGAASVFAKAKIYVAYKFPSTRKLRTDVYQQFGDANKYLKQDVLESIHVGVNGGSFHFAFSFFYRFRRHHYWHHAGWEHRNIMRYGSSGREFLPAINWHRCHRQSYWSPRHFWQYNTYGCRRLDWVISTTRVTNGNQDYAATYNGEQWITLTLGRWHHLAYSCNKYSCTAYLVRPCCVVVCCVVVSLS